jgi:hypothetical protein
MNIQWMQATTALALLFTGCASHTGYQDFYRDRYAFAESQVPFWHKTALEAASSPKEWARVGKGRITAGPIDLESSHLDYRLDCSDPSEIDVIVHLAFPASQEHATFVRVRLERYAGIVMWMREERYDGHEP